MHLGEWGSLEVEFSLKYSKITFSAQEKHVGLLSEIAISSLHIEVLNFF